MEYRRMGNTGLKLSALSLGTWATVGDSLDEARSRELIRAAFDHGINLFDTAEVYSAGEAERQLGRILCSLGLPRDALVICTKVMWGTRGKLPNSWGLSRKHIFEGLDSSLKRLQLDYVDILLCHRHDPETSLEETVSAMGDLVRLGKVLYWGTSEWQPELIWKAREIAARLGVAAPVVEQTRYNLFHRRRVEVDLYSLVRDAGLGICAWSPLAYGLLTGRYQKDDPDGRLNRPELRWLKEEALGGGQQEKRFAAIDGLVKFAEIMGATPALLALAWSLSHSSISSVVTGASSVEQLRSNLNVFQLLPLTREVTANLEGIFRAAGEKI